jgi:hypothetical protein
MVGMMKNAVIQKGTCNKKWPWGIRTKTRKSNSPTPLKEDEVIIFG